MGIFDENFSSEEPLSDVLITQDPTYYDSNPEAFSNDSPAVTTSDSTASGDTQRSTDYLKWIGGVADTIAKTAASIGSAVRTVNSADNVYQANAGVGSNNPKNTKSIISGTSTTSVLFIGAVVLLAIKLFKA